jgi:hypothetical protein
MPGYAAQIKAEDRWAIVAYVRALQLSRNADINWIPEEKRAEILETQESVQQKLLEEATTEEQPQDAAAQE